MNALRLYIWEGDGISDAYHDDGTLVVLADSPAHARAVVEATRKRAEAISKARQKLYAEVEEKKRTYAMSQGGYRREIWETDEGKALIAEQSAVHADEVALNSLVPDGTPEALAREPDRVVELTEPTIVAFNGGGYD